MGRNTYADPFGRLPGIAQWQARLADEVLHEPRSGASLAVILIEVQPQVSDLGIAAVSEGVLALVGEALRRSLRGRDFVARVGTSRFAILLSPSNAAGAAAVVQRLPRSVQKAVGECMPAGMVPELLIGHVVAPQEAANAASLLARAEAALAQRNTLEAQALVAAARPSFLVSSLAL